MDCHLERSSSLFCIMRCISSILAFMNVSKTFSMGTAEKSAGRLRVEFTMPFSFRFLRPVQHPNPKRHFVSWSFGFVSDGLRGGREGSML